MLEEVIDSAKSEAVLNDPDGDDYSTWDGFCDTPIFGDRLLNAVRVKCHALTRARNTNFFSVTREKVSITQEGKEEIAKLISQIKSDHE